MLSTILDLYARPKKNIVRVAFSHNSTIERIWTYIPTGILILIAIPSFALLYAIDELADPLVTMKVIGRQWY